MINDSESFTSNNKIIAVPQPSGWLKVGVIAAASALIGGLSVAWWYRKTLGKLRQTEDSGQNPQFNSSSDDPGDED